MKNMEPAFKVVVGLTPVTLSLAYKIVSLGFAMLHFTGVYDNSGNYFFIDVAVGGDAVNSPSSNSFTSTLFPLTPTT